MLNELINLNVHINHYVKNNLFLCYEKANIIIIRV
jgi:hypothetical protein